MRNLSSVIWGLLLIGVGVILGGNALNFWHIDIFFDGWWTLFIIVPCLIGILRSGFHWGNVVGLCIGVVLLFSCWEIVPWHLIWQLMIPLLLVVMGLGVLFNRGERKMKDKNFHQSAEKVSSFCSSSENRILNEKYFGGKVSAVMGSAVLDLRNAVIEEDIRIQIDVFMGSAEIFFPPYVHIIVDSSPFLGSVENKTNQNSSVNAPTVYLVCSAVLGGIELK